MEMPDEKQQEIMYKMQVFEQQMQQVQQQLQMIEQGKVELNDMSKAIEDLKGKTGKEIMAPIGRGIYVKAKLVSEDLTVDIGGKKFVKKDIDQTKETIAKQLEKLDEVNKQLDKTLEDLNKEVMELFSEVEGVKSQ